MQSFGGSGKFFSSPRWVRARALVKRTLNEGFGAFALSITLFTIGLCLLRTYWLDRVDLQSDIRDQILATVGTPQEPTDASQTGLIAAALATINEKHEEICDGADSGPRCTHLEAFNAEVSKSLNAGLLTPGDAPSSPDLTKKDPPPPNSGTEENLPYFPISPRDVSRPEFMSGPLCRPPDGDRISYLLMPVQMDRFLKDARVANAIRISSAFDDVLRKYRSDPTRRPLFESVVQAYFISPDSVLRIWSLVDANACKDFNKTRLWASKAYFTFFWDHPDRKSFTTQIYIDYGGNGLVRTRCEQVNQAGAQNSERGNLLGVVCLDFMAGSPEVDKKLYNQLFFETASVEFPANNDPSLATVDLKGVAEPAEPKPEAQAGSSGTLAAITPSSRPNLRDQDRKGEGSQAGKNFQISIRMQPGTLKEEEVRQALKDIKDPGAVLRRDITRIAFRERAAFLIPLGPPTGRFRALFFYPRSPALTTKDLCFQGIGFALIGAAIASAGFGSRLRTKAEQLRDRLNLLRSMQVAFLQVDSNDWILEANDRAEELFRRQLPKPGVTRLKVNFRHLIETRLVEMTVAGSPTKYVEITEQDVARMRARGEASSYYARLSENSANNGAQSRGEQTPRWLRVSATPMMDVDEHEAAANRVHLLSISATAYEVPNETAQQLEDVIQLRKHAQSTGE